MKELLEICGVLRALDGKPCALATVISVEGSAYRRPGARMLIMPEGQTWGMISGGCLEHDILERARQAIKSGESSVVRYDSTSNDDIIFGTGLGCNGIIEVFIEPIIESLRTSLIEAVECCCESRRPGAIATLVETEMDDAQLSRHSFLMNDRWLGAGALAPLLKDYRPQDGDALLAVNGGSDPIRVFVQALLPPIQLVAFGGWLDVIPLIRMGREVGFRTAVVDARLRESSTGFFREADMLLLCSPNEALSRIQFDDRTVVVLMNHHFEGDQDALAALTQVSVPFLGMLGPKRRQQRLIEAIKSDGASVSEEFVQTLHGPVGLDIGAKTPEEIALSIMSEILAVLNERNAKPIRDRAMPLHISSPTLAYA
jgi:xanthine dehydrogenase accessory factor